MKRIRGKIDGADVDFEIEGDSPATQEILTELRSQRTSRQERETHEAGEKNREQQRQAELEARKAPLRELLFRHQAEILDMSARHMEERKVLFPTHEIGTGGTEAFERRSAESRALSEQHGMEREALRDLHAQDWATIRGQA